MLAGFAVNSRSAADLVKKGDPWNTETLAKNPYAAYKSSNMPVSGSKNDMDFGWLVY